MSDERRGVFRIWTGHGYMGHWTDQLTARATFALLKRDGAVNIVLTAEWADGESELLELFERPLAEARS